MKLYPSMYPTILFHTFCKKISNKYINIHKLFEKLNIKYLDPNPFYVPFESLPKKGLLNAGYKKFYIFILFIFFLLASR